MPPLAAQFDLLVLIQPCPLQLFCPLHELDAVLQELVPLHELMPEHFTSAIFAPLDLAILAEPPPVEQPASNKVAAAAAIDKPVTFNAVFIISILL